MDYSEAYEYERQKTAAMERSIRDALVSTMTQAIESKKQCYQRQLDEFSEEQWGKAAKEDK